MIIIVTYYLTVVTNIVVKKIIIADYCTQIQHFGCYFDVVVKYKQLVIMMISKVCVVTNFEITVVALYFLSISSEK